MIPIIIKRAKDPEPVPARGSTYYIYAANGIYQVKRTPMYEVCAKVDHEVPGMEHQSQYMRPKFSMIPSDLMDQVMSFFRRVYADLNGEAIVELYYNAESKEWLALPPVQGVSGSHKAPEEYGHAFEDCAHIEKATFGTSKHGEQERYEAEMGAEWADAGYGAWGGHYVGSGYNTHTGGYGTTGWHSLLYQPSAEAPPPGFMKMGTIHSHMDMSAYFSGTDDADDRYGDGLHLVFGRIKNKQPTLSACVAARFMSNGTPFTWDKDQYETLLDPFIDPDADFPEEWLKKCHFVETVHRGDTEVYVSCKSKQEKKAAKKAAKAASWPATGRTGGSMGAGTPLGNRFHCGDQVEFDDHAGIVRRGRISSVVFHREGSVSYGIKWNEGGRTTGGVSQAKVRLV